MSKKRTLAIAVAALATSGAAHAALVVGSSGQLFIESFDSLASTAGGAWTNDSTLAGWSLFAQPAPGTAITTYNVGDGVSNAGSFYSFGTTGSSDRALGGVGSGGAYFGTPLSGAVAGWIAVALTNNTGTTLDGFSVSFSGEQWRNGGNTSGQTMALQYGFGSTFASVASWLTPGGMFDWTSAVNTATAAAVNGNTTGLVAGRGGSVTTPWSAGSTLWLRWIENNDVGNDHGLAIDNFAFTAGVAPVPLPASLPLLAAALGGFGWIRRRLAASPANG
jgi:hypothetical protein